MPFVEATGEQRAKVFAFLATWLLLLLLLVLHLHFLLRVYFYCILCAFVLPCLCICVCVWIEDDLLLGLPRPHSRHVKLGSPSLHALKVRASFF